MSQQMFKSIPQLHFNKPARDRVNEMPRGKTLVEENVKRNSLGIQFMEGEWKNNGG